MKRRQRKRRRRPPAARGGASPRDEAEQAQQEDETASARGEQRQREADIERRRQEAADAERRRQQIEAERRQAEEAARRREEEIASSDRFAEFRAEHDEPTGVRRLIPVTPWARVETNGNGDHKVADDDLRRLIDGFRIPPTVAAVSYPRGCRIRRVRVRAQKAPAGAGEKRRPLIVSRRALRGTTDERNTIAVTPTHGLGPQSTVYGSSNEPASPPRRRR